MVAGFAPYIPAKLGRRDRVNIHHVTQGDSRQVRYVVGVDFSDSACAEDRCIDHIIVSRFVGLLRVTQ